MTGVNYIPIPLPVIEKLLPDGVNVKVKPIIFVSSDPVPAGSQEDIKFYPPLGKRYKLLIDRGTSRSDQT